MNENTFYQHINLDATILSGEKYSNVTWKKKATTEYQKHDTMCELKKCTSNNTVYHSWYIQT